MGILYIASIGVVTATVGLDPLITALVGVVIGGMGSLRRAAILMLVQMILVVALYIFSGMSGALSFGHMSFVTVGAYTSMLLATDPAHKALVLPNLPPPLAAVHLPSIIALPGHGRDYVGEQLTGLRRNTEIRH